MKFSLKAIAVAAMLAVPSVSHAQFDSDVALQMKGFKYPTTGTNYPDGGKAGGFFADFVIDFPTTPNATFSDYLVWCIDVDRNVSPEGGPYTYWAFTAENFANGSAYGANGHNVTQAEMEKIAGLAYDLEVNWDTYSDEQRADRQGSIWALFRGDQPVMQNLQGVDLTGWYVLFNDRNQSFITRVPEPSSGALLLIALAGFGAFVVARRRTA